MKTRLELGSLGIISSEQKRALECYVDARAFRQRKTFDEYYVDLTSFERVIDLRDLMILAERFKIIVLEDAVIVTDTDT
ncbi:MAG: hypothetical protein GY804_15040 [Alphaproteobacteria bacterium]|nr:hypothetical protein [Alphaproteobacteria bacterium]